MQNTLLNLNVKVSNVNCAVWVPRVTPPPPLAARLASAMDTRTQRRYTMDTRTQRRYTMDTRTQRRYIFGCLYIER